jgi:hypothetical protein
MSVEPQQFLGYNKCMSFYNYIIKIIYRGKCFGSINCCWHILATSPSCEPGTIRISSITSPFINKEKNYQRMRLKPDTNNSVTNSLTQYPSAVT